MILLILVILVFLAGLYFYTKYHTPKLLEGLTNNTQEIRCPNILIQHGAKYFLYNSNVAKVPGVNPIEFDNLEEYVEFIDWQHSQGIRCPILYLQNGYDAQGKPVYKIRPSATDLQGGMPPAGPSYMKQSLYDSMNEMNEVNETDKMSRVIGINGINSLNTPINPNIIQQNINSYPAYHEPTSVSAVNMGLGTNAATNGPPILEEDTDDMLYSPNAMDDNWAGADYTQKLVDQGVYKDDEVYMY